MSVGRVLDENGALQEHTFQIGGGTIVSEFGAVEAPPDPRRRPAAPPVPVLTPAVAAVPVPVVAPPFQPPKQLSTRQILSQLKARLRVVEREIRVRKTLEQERDRIRRLIAAANQERDNLRRIRSAG